MRQVVINTSYGGFGLSDEAIELYGKYNNLNLIKQGKSYYIDDDYRNNFNHRYIKRDDPILIRVVNELGDKANGKYSKLKIVEIPSDVQYTIEEYDGDEWIAEEHRTWD